MRLRARYEKEQRGSDDEVFPGRDEWARGDDLSTGVLPSFYHFTYSVKTARNWYNMEKASFWVEY